VIRRARPRHKYRKVTELEDDAAVPRTCHVSTESIGDAEGGLVGGLLYVGAVAAAGAIVALGGTLAGAIVAAALASTGTVVSRIKSGTGVEALGGEDMGADRFDQAILPPLGLQVLRDLKCRRLTDIDNSVAHQMLRRDLGHTTSTRPF